jgi:hypothetical protein
MRKWCHKVKVDTLQESRKGVISHKGTMWEGVPAGGVQLLEMKPVGLNS